MKTTTKANRNHNGRDVGIDVSKSHLDIFILQLDRHWRVENTPEGIKALIRDLKRFKLSRVLVEATGGYERLVVEMLAEKEIPIIVVQPIAVKQFAKAQGVLAKTDKLDAKMIAQFGAVMQPAVKPISSKKIRYIRDLLARKRQLTEARTQELNRRQKAPKAIEAMHNRMIKFLDKEIEKINTLLAKEVESVDEWRSTLTLLKSVPGVGDGVAFTLLGELPELGDLTQRQVAALCGLAPYNHDSGKMQGKRRIKGGRAPIRSMLYMAMMCAIQHNRKMKEFYERLVANGKHKKVALTACMRKLMTILNAMVRDKKHWMEA